MHHAPEKQVSEIEIRNVLFLENDSELADTFKELLEMNNFVVTVVRNGVDGLKEIMAMDFDVIVCDLMMPKMPGDMFYYAVERTKEHLCSRFVFITGYAGNPRVNKFLAKAKGISLIKPIHIDDLIQAIGKVLGGLRNTHPEE